jgi:hypothetical protein
LLSAAKTPVKQHHKFSLLGYLFDFCSKSCCMDTKALLSKKKFRLSLAVIVSISIALLPVYIAAILKLIIWLIG